MRWLLAALAVVGLVGTAPADAAAVTFPTSCVDPAHAFTIGVPEGWWAHPADPSRGIGPCQHFGPGPFELTPNEQGALTGEAIRVSWIINSCVGFVEPPKSNEVLEVAGHPARRIEVVPSDSPTSAAPDYAMTYYWVQLSEEECAADSSFLDISTTAAAGHYARNVEVLDQMVQTISLGVADSAIPGPRGQNGATVLGLLLIVLALCWPIVLYSQPRRRK